EKSSKWCAHRRIRTSQRWVGNRLV
ncbi:uncharacterized protein METZ01_LOCUS263646, partial [marine metagenome]